MSKWEALPDDHKAKIKKFVEDRNRDALAPLDENQLDEVRKNIIKHVEEVPDQPSDAPGPSDTGPSDAPGPSDPEPSDQPPSDPEPSDPPEPLDQPPSDPEPSDPPEPLDQPPSDPEPSDPQTDGKISKDGGEEKEEAQPNENTDGGEKKEDTQPNENTDGGEEKKNMSEKPVEKMADTVEESATNLISNDIDNMDDVSGMHEVRENSVDIAPDFVQTFFNFINSLVDSPSETTNGQCKPIVEQATIDNVSDASNVSNTSDVSTVADSSVGTTATAMGMTVQQEQAAAPENMLPEGWSEHVSQSSDPGKKYYVNESTGETTWDRPGGNAGEKTNEPTGPKETGDNKLPEGWSEHVSQSSDPGKKYYVNESTGETTWDRPGGNDGEKTNEPKGPKETGDDKLPEGWSEHVSQSSDPGKKYYVNESTGETTWDRPGGNKGEDKPSKPKEPSSAAVPAGWTAHVSESSDPGRIYYVNDTTGETTWTKPTVMDNWVKKTSQNVQPGKEYYENTTTGNTRWAPPLMPSNDDECNQCKKKGKMPHTSFFIKNNRAQKVCFCSIECFEKTEF